MGIQGAVGQISSGLGLGQATRLIYPASELSLMVS